MFAIYLMISQRKKKLVRIRSGGRDSYLKVVVLINKIKTQYYKLNRVSKAPNVKAFMKLSH